MTPTTSPCPRTSVSSKFAWVLTAGLFIAQIVPAATLTVCASGCDHSSIQAAVHAATGGDKLLLSPETFLEGGIWINKDLTIRTSQGRATVNGGSERYVFQVHPNAKVSFKDLTLRGGTDFRFDNLGVAKLYRMHILGDPIYSTFGGIMNQSSGRLRLYDHSIVAGNASVNDSGGINNTGDLVILTSTITNNIGFSGGGLRNNQGVVSVRNSSFTDNHATNSGGAWADIHAAGTVANHSSNTYSGNTADNDCDNYWNRGEPVDCVN